MCNHRLLIIIEADVVFSSTALVTRTSVVVLDLAPPLSVMPPLVEGIGGKTIPQSRSLISAPSRVASLGEYLYSRALPDETKGSPQR